MKRHTSCWLKEKKLRIYSLLAVGLLIATGSNSAWGQVAASISGRIQDASGAAVPAATVTVTSLETGAARTVMTDQAGNYRVLALLVGRYEIKAEKTGFKAGVQKGITLVVGQEAVVNLKLEVGEVRQEVTVTGEGPVVNTTTASVSGLVGERQVKELPLNGRSFDNLITLNPGAVDYTGHTSTAVSGSGEGKSFAVMGRRPTENLFLLNGVEYTGASIVAVTPGGVSGQLLGIDGIREFNVVSGSYSAEYGKRAGAQVSIVTQSGTNQLHGGVFEFLRNSKLDARNFFDQGNVPPFKRNQFGGFLGGPIRKDKTFIFGNYEGFRQRLGLSGVTFVPDLNARQGLFPNAQGVPAPVPNLNPAMLPYMAFWPVPNGPNLGGGIAEAFSNPKQSIREDFGTMRFDQNFSDKDSLSGTYTVDDGYNLTPMSDPLFGTQFTLRNQVASLQETHLFSPQLINVFTAGFSRGGFGLLTPPLESLPSGLSFISGKPPGAIIIGGGAVTTANSITNAGAGATPSLVNARSLFTYQDGIQGIKGKHQISAGVWFQRMRTNVFGPVRGWGNAQFSNLQSFLQGTVATFTYAAAATPIAWRSLYGAWYVQDIIQLRPNLSFSLGLRHEFSNGWNEARGRASTFLFDPNGLVITNPRVGDSFFTDNNARWLFGPRVGLAWDPFGKGKTSIRAGFGTSYYLQDSLSFYISNQPPFNGTVAVSNVPLSSLVPVVSGIPLPPSCGPGAPPNCTTYQPRGVQPTMKTPAVQSWNFSVEQQLFAGTALRLAYVGSHGVHGLISNDPNTIHAQICSNPAGCISGGIGSARGTVPQGAEYIPVGTRPNPYISYATILESKGDSSYNALQVEVTQRLSRGLQFRANYTWSKNLDLTSATGTSLGTNESQNIMNAYNPGRDWGPAALNVSHQGTGNFTYELPIGQGKVWLNGVTGVADKLASGWQVNGIVTLLSGFPSTPLVGSSRSGNGDFYTPDRPSENPAFNGPVIVGSPNQWFNPNAYVLPTVGTFGNVGRGVLTGPELASVDFSVFKNTRITEQLGLQFRAEVFNIFNHANFGSPNALVFSGNNFSSTAGIISATVTTSRQMQFGLKLSF
jgi:carboxypeptidase family protein